MRSRAIYGSNKTDLKKSPRYITVAAKNKSHGVTRRFGLRPSVRVLPRITLKDGWRGVDFGLCEGGFRREGWMIDWGDWVTLPLGIPWQGGGVWWGWGWGVGAGGGGFGVRVAALALVCAWP